MQIRNDAALSKSQLTPPSGAALKPAPAAEAPIQESLAKGQSSEIPGLMKAVQFAAPTSVPLLCNMSCIPTGTSTVGQGPADPAVQERLLKALTSKGVPIPRDTTIIVLGAESDNVLNRTPGRSLAVLADQGILDPAMGHRVILADRIPISNEDYLKKFETGDPGQSLAVNKTELGKFAKIAHLDSTAPGDGIVMVDAKTPADFVNLKALTASAKNILFFISLPPFLAGSVLSSISEAGIGREPGQKLNIIQEKPFGTDLASAKALASLIDTKFAPGEVLNIDHFNGYPGTLNSLLHRLDPTVNGVLNKDYVDDIHVILQEQVKSNDRKAFIGMGIVKDMQGHALQTASTILSDYPSGDALTGESIGKAKDEFISQYQVDPNNVRRGQFEGFSDPAQGFPADLKPSDAETLETSNFKINNDRWNGVPGHTTLVKGSDATKFGVDLHLKKLSPDMAAKLGVDASTPGTLTFEIHPHDTVSFTPDGGKSIELPFHKEVGENPPYVPFFVSAANQNPAPFVSTKGAVEGWNSVETVRNNWGPAESMVHYPVGASLDDIQRLVTNPPAASA